MSQAESAIIKICAYQLSAGEEAVIRRVVAFSQSQGAPYEFSEWPDVDWLIISDDTHIPMAEREHSYRVIRIIDKGKDNNTDNEMDKDIDQDADKGNEYSHPVDELVIRRPLLLNRVMRMLDQGRKSWSKMASNHADYLSGHAAVHASGHDPIAQITQPVHTQEPATEQVVIGPFHQTQPTESPTAFKPNYKALVVDDSAAIRKQMQLELQQAGIGTDFAEDGLQALEKVAHHSYDLIFLDIIMPGMDGYEVCRQLRSQAPLKKTPIIMLSAKSSPLDEVQGVIAGASTYLTKPVKTQQLQKVLQRVASWLADFRA